MLDGPAVRAGDLDLVAGLDPDDVAVVPDDVADGPGLVFVDRLPPLDDRKLDFGTVGRLDDLPLDGDEVGPPLHGAGDGGLVYAEYLRAPDA